MANTIQLKRGTGSSVPSSLAEGELAINLDSGKLYYGSGSSVVSDFRFDTITAETYVISSSVTHMTTSFSSGSTAFGDTADDTHTFTGHIAVSGQISSSTNIMGSRLYLDNKAILSLASSDTELRVGFNNGINSLQYGKNATTSHLFVGNITASGAISASGEVTTNMLRLTPGANDYVTSTGTSVSIKSANESINLIGNVTASSNVSASGAIVASNLSGTNTGDQTKADIDALGIAATTAVSLTAGDKTIQGNLRLGGTGDTGNNWISIDAQSGNDSSGGGITFFEAGTYDVDSPQYGAKIVYNETADEFAIGTMHNNVFKRQIYFGRELARTYFNGDLQIRDSSPAITIVDTNTTVASGDVVGVINFSNEDDDGSTLRIQAVATEDHASGTNGGTKLEIKTTPNGSSAEAVALTVGEDKSLTVASHITASGDVSASGDIFGSSLDLNDSTEARIDMYQAGTQRIKISGRAGQNSYFNAGNVAIGLDTPTEKLHVQGNITASGTITADSFSGNRKFEKSSATGNNLAQGDIIYVGAGSTTAGDLVYMKTTGEWGSAQANHATTSTSLLGIALGTDPDVDGVLLRGTYTLDHNIGDNQGVLLYVSDTVAGQATTTIPNTSGDIIRIVGYNIGDDDQIWFDPDKTFIEV